MEKAENYQSSFQTSFTRVMSFSDIKNGYTLQVRLVIKFEATIAYELR